MKRFFVLCAVMGLLMPLALGCDKKPEAKPAPPAGAPATPPADTPPATEPAK